MTAKDIALVATSIATSIGTVVGAGVSVYALHLQARKDKPSIKTRVRIGALVYAGTRLGNEALLFLEAINTGNKAVKITSVSIQLPNKRLLALLRPDGNVRLPYMLTEEDNCTLWVTIKGLAKELFSEGYNDTAKVRAVFRDSAGREYKSKKFKIEGPNGWAE